MHSFKIADSRGCLQTHYIKLRQGLREMLDTLAPFFKFRIYTQGNRVYVNEVVKVIDPQTRHFSSWNIVCRDDSDLKVEDKIKYPN